MDVRRSSIENWVASPFMLNFRPEILASARPSPAELFIANFRCRVFLSPRVFAAFLISLDSPELRETQADIWYLIYNTRLITFCLNEFCVPSDKSVLIMWRKSIHIYKSTYLFAYVLQGDYKYSLQVSYSLFLLAFHTPVCLSSSSNVWLRLRSVSHSRKYPSAYQLVQKLKPRHLSQKHFSEEEFYCNLHKMWGQPSLKQPLERKN